MSKIIAIDFGLKRSGIAITDALQMIASPLTTVPSQELETFLKTICAKDDISEIVLGMTLDTLGRPTDITPNVEMLFKVLKEKHPKQEVSLYDERFTSKMASAALVASGMKKSQRKVKGNLDMTSAAILLQGYLRSKESRFWISTFAA